MSKANTAEQGVASSEERSGVSEQRRRELADFLRTRREKIKPEQVGIMHLSRRRTPGLRREEVAEMAGVGTTWYTWLEQARDIQPSSEVLRRLSSALRMNSAETKHLFTLAGKAHGIDPDFSKNDIPSPGLLKFFNGLPQAAFLVGSRWDILALNPAMSQGSSTSPSGARVGQNYIEYIFTQRHLLKNWESNCRRLLAEFRASLGDSVDHPWVIEAIEKLRETCPEFEGWWKEHDVHDNSPAIVETHTKHNGFSRFERIVLLASENPRLKFLIFSPLD